jgi:hypothetical protein
LDLRAKQLAILAAYIRARKIFNKKKERIRYKNLANSMWASRILFAGGQGNADLGNVR